MQLSERVKWIKPSATLAVTEKAASLRRQGVEVIDLGAGEPDFDTPEHIKEAARRALARGETKYTPVGGTDELKAAIVAKLARDNGVTYAKNEVMANCGGKHALFVLFQALFNEGDEVLVPAPYWVSYPDMLLLSGARARIVFPSPGQDFKLRPQDLETALTPRTKAVILNSPSNPAGVAYTPAELAELLDVLGKHDCWIISDDVYEKMVYGDFVLGQVLQVRPDLRPRTILCNSVSKTYAMTGWRIGYTAGPAEVIKAMTTIQGQMTSNPSSVAQAAAAEALTGDQEPVARMMAEFGKRREFVVERLRAIPGIECSKPQGAFYVFPNVSAYLGKPNGPQTGDELAAYLIEKVHVAVVGGTDFGYPTHIRISYANSMENLNQALERMAAALAELRGRS
ncbi:MAG: pyridoxal phosphate-dependent aminotransferase [Candidatus Binatia bacterium]|nr:pyridoxal phosphate-dependent aminotransferase [Candidatus Binatia bacterium]